MSRQLKFYSLLLGLYPAQFQKAYKHELLQTTADMLDHAGSGPARALVWLRIWVDLPTSVMTEQLNYQGDLYMNDTPKYLKTTSLVSAVMLLPFLAVLLANSLDKLIFHSNLNGSWLWRFPYLGLWVLWLPEAALLLVVVSLIFYLIRGNTDSNWLHRAVDIRRTWPVILPGLFAFGILFIIAFHDSFQCFMVSPGYLLQHSSKVLQCAINNNALPGFRRWL